MIEYSSPTGSPGRDRPAAVDERDTTCCYAGQDKFWVQGASDGESWEVYTVLADSQTFLACDEDRNRILNGPVNSGCGGPGARW